MPGPTIKRLSRSALTTVLTTATMTATTAPATAAWRHKHPAARQGRHHNRYKDGFNDRLQLHYCTLTSTENNAALYQGRHRPHPTFT